MRPAILLAAVLLALVAALPAETAARTRADRENGISFRLTGSLLTVRILPPDGTERDSTPEEQLYGRRVVAGCGGGSSRLRIVVRSRRWPDGRRSLRFRLSHAVSRRTVFCFIEEEDGADIAAVFFRSPRFAG